MRLSADGSLRLSPSDLANYLACAHLTQLDAARPARRAPSRRHRETRRPTSSPQGRRARGGVPRAAPRPRDARSSSIVLRRRDRLRRRPRGARRRRSAPGADVIYQGVPRLRRLARVRRLPRPARRAVRSRARARTRPWDTKLARHAKPPHVLQLTFYSHELERIQGVLPGAHARRARHGRSRRTFRPADFAAFYRRARARLEDAVAQRPETYPYPVDHCGICDFCAGLRRALGRRRPPRAASRASAATRSSGSTLAGIATLEALGDTPSGHVGPAHGRRRRSRRSATRPRSSSQRGARGTHRYELLEPPRAPRPRAAARRRRRATSSTTSRATRSGSPGAGSSTCTASPTRTAASPRSGRTTATRSGRARAASSAASASASPRTRACTSTTTRSYEAVGAQAPDGRARDPRGRARRAAPPRDLRRPATRSRGRRSASRTRATRSRRCASSSWRRATELEGGDDAIVAYERWIDERDPAILDAIERYNEEDCLSNLLPARLAARAARGGGGAVRRRDPVAAAPEPSEPDEEATAFAAARAEPQTLAAATGDEAHALMARPARVPPPRGASRLVVVLRARAR